MKNTFLKSILLAIAILFITGLSPLWAQSSSYYMVLRFVQRLTWTGDEYSMRYEVIIEKEEEGKYRRFSQEFTEKNFIEVSLLPGNYRYQVIPHDFLDQPITVNEWTSFQILRGDNKLTTGEHEIIIVNPTDETSRKAIVLIGPETADTSKTEEIPETKKIDDYKNSFDIYLGAAYIPLLPIYSNNKFFGDDLTLYGAGIRLAIISAKESFISTGMELITSWHMYEPGSGKTVHSLTFDFNLMVQTRLPGNRTAINSRWGAGVSLLPETDPLSSVGRYSLHANIGISFLYLIRENLYLETGVDYSQFFTRDYFGFLRPWVGFGYRF